MRALRGIPTMLRESLFTDFITHTSLAPAPIITLFRKTKRTSCPEAIGHMRALHGMQ